MVVFCYTIDRAKGGSIYMKCANCKNEARPNRTKCIACVASQKKWAIKHRIRLERYRRDHAEKKLGRKLRWTYTRQPKNTIPLINRIKRYGNYFTIKMSSPFGPQIVYIDNEFMSDITSAASIRIFNSRKNEMTNEERLYVQLMYKHKSGKISKTVYLHRLVAGILDAGRSIHAHYVNENSLDNRKRNLEVMTASEHSILTRRNKS